jgi:peptidoglycan/LPS O-acetylase OafA/YrhL
MGRMENTTSDLVDMRTWLRERIDGRICVVLGVAWIVLFQIAAALEPATNRAEPAYSVVLGLIMWGLLATMVTGLVMQRRFGLLASLGAAGFMTLLSVACPISGHHPFGAWWFGQLTCVLLLVVASLVALASSSAAPADSAHADSQPVA